MEDNTQFAKATAEIVNRKVVNRKDATKWSFIRFSQGN
jgi:hypothetical protein